ncbi:MAG: hypothetical protein L6R28_08050 [Planctomycetes bacterium]|nr:hypothetical protein [Planctomycetota bacterium]
MAVAQHNGAVARFAAYLFLCAACTVLQARAEQSAPPPGPLVEVVLKSDAAAPMEAYLLAFRNGELQVRPVAGGTDRTIGHADVQALRFLPMPEPQPEPTPTPEGITDGQSKGTEKDGPLVRPGKAMGLLGRLLMKLSESPLTEGERRELRMLALTPPKDLTPEKLKRADELFEKAEIPNVPLFLHAFGDAKEAQDRGALTRYMTAHREALKKVPDERTAFAEAVRLAAGYAQDSTDLTDLTGKMLDELKQSGQEAAVRKRVGDRMMQTLKATVDLLKQHEKDEGQPDEPAGPRHRPLFKRLQRPVDR